MATQDSAPQASSAQSPLSRAAELGLAIKALAPETSALVAELVELASQADVAMMPVSEHRKAMLALNEQAMKPRVNFPMGARKP